MAYGFVMDVAAPIEFYDALHAAVLDRVDDVDGLLVHVARETAGGFQITEVRESEELCERYTAEIVGPALAELSGGRPAPTEPVRQEFEPRGLVVPAAHVVV